MEEKGILVSQEGYEKLEKELDYLKTTKRAEIAEKIKVALGFGDLSENSEYDEAKNEQAQVEMKIVDLENNIELLVNNLSDKNKELISDYQSQN